MAATDKTSGKHKTESFLDASEEDLLKIANLCMDRAGSALLTQPVHQQTLAPDSPAEVDDFTKLRLFLEAQLCLSEAARKRAEDAAKRDRLHNRKIETRDFWMEVGVMALIGIEILLSLYGLKEGKNQADVMRSMATSANLTATYMTEATRDLHDQLQAQHELRDQATRSANAAEASAKTAAQTQRASIATTTLVVQQPAPGQQTRFHWAWTNVGHTTALHVSPYARLIEVVPVPNGLGQLNPMTIPVPSSLRQAHEMARSDWSAHHVAPMTLEAGQEVHSDPLWRTYTAEGIDSLKAGKIRLYLFVHVTYDDIFGHHETESCGSLNTDFTGFVACEEDFNKSR